jgi:hypothetical protein
MPLHDRRNLLPLGHRSKPYARVEQLPYGGITTNAGEDEHDRRQQLLVVEQLDQLRPARHPQ